MKSVSGLESGIKRGELAGIQCLIPRVCLVAAGRIVGTDEVGRTGGLSVELTLFES